MVLSRKVQKSLGNQNLIALRNLMCIPGPSMVPVSDVFEPWSVFVDP